VDEVRLPGAAFREYLVGGLGPGEGAAAVVPAVDEVLDGVDEAGTEAKLPQRMACRVMIEKKTSTMFSHDSDVGVKCSVIRGCWASQACTSGWVP